MHEFVRSSYQRLVDRNSGDFEDNFVFLSDSVTTGPSQRQQRRWSGDALFRRFLPSFADNTIEVPKTHGVAASPMQWDEPDSAYAKQAARNAGYSDVIAFTLFSDVNYPPRPRPRPSRRFSRRISLH